MRRLSLCSTRAQCSTWHERVEPCVVAHIVLHMVSSLGYRNDARPSGRALKIMKELRYIKELRERLKRGEKLESLQRPKVARESELRCELRDLLEEKSFTSEITYTTTNKGVLHKVKKRTKRRQKKNRIILQQRVTGCSAATAHRGGQGELPNTPPMVHAVPCKFKELQSEAV